MAETTNTLAEALREAAQSLETIARNAGKALDTDGQENYLRHFDQVRGYANSRATVARAALAQAEAKPAPALSNPVTVYTNRGAAAAAPAPDDESTCFGAGDVVRLRAGALAVFGGPECPQIARDVIEWYHAALLAEVGVLVAAPAAPAYLNMDALYSAWLTVGADVAGVSWARFVEAIAASKENTNG